MFLPIPEASTLAIVLPCKFGNQPFELAPRFDPLSGTVTRADFELQGTTSCADKSSFREFLAANHRSLREQVMVTIRNSRVSDLDDPQLRLLEKKLMARVNRALGRRFLRTVDIKNFQLYQSAGKVPSGDDDWQGEEPAAAPWR